ncbi:MAG: PorP/SprF family type IX secretion system membrane protein [Chitinophagaceae bacterium]
MKRSLLTLLTVVIFISAAYAQDIHFSQFFASPLTLNPALTGNFDGNLRVAGNYRDQWPTISRAFTTSTISADFPILTSRLPENDRLALGIMGYTDQQADGVLKNNFGSISIAYHKGMDEEGNNRLSVGFQAVYCAKNLNTASLKFEDQLRSDGFTGFTNEIFQGRSFNIGYFDLNAGICYSGTTANNTNFYIGASIYHLTKPKETFAGGQFYLNQRYTIHGGVYFPMGDQVMLHTSAMYQNQGGAHEGLVGAALGYSLGSDYDSPTTLYAGSWFRVGDALIPYLGLEYGKFRLGLTYDVTTSALKSQNLSRGGFEFSLIYVNKPSGEHSLPCPKF